MNTGSAEAGLISLYDAREFAPDDEEIADVIRQVEEALGRGGIDLPGGGPE